MDFSVGREFAKGQPRSVLRGPVLHRLLVQEDLAMLLDLTDKAWSHLFSGCATLVRIGRRRHTNVGRDARLGATAPYWQNLLAPLRQATHIRLLQRRIDQPVAGRI